MPEYLTKEEVRQWRSSLERITLEEYAARLGKVIQEEKHTNDMIDKVMTTSLNSISDTSYRYQSEKIQSIALRPIEKKEKSNTEIKDNKKPPVNVSETIKANKISSAALYHLHCHLTISPSQCVEKLSHTNQSLVPK